VTTFTEKAKELKQKIVDNRLKMFGIDRREKDCLQTDDFRSCDSYYYASDRLCDWKSPEIRQFQHGPESDLAKRKEEVRKVYNRDLDELLKPIAHWPSLTPMARSTDANGRPVAQLDDASAAAATPPVKTDKATPAESRRSELITPPVKTDKANDVGSGAAATGR
jgi:hypothetical protein